jgi:endonuclease VIII
MPEGDTLFRAAHALSARICGTEIVSLQLFHSDQQTAGLIGETVRSVDAHGKHLFLGLGRRALLHLHFRMTGVVHVYRPGQPLRRARNGATFALTTPNAVVWGFRIPVAQLHFERRAREQILAGIGADILGTAWSAERAVISLQQRPDVAIGDALLDQSRIAGIGNVYKSETLFVARANPLTPVSQFSESTLCRIVTVAAGLMRANVPESRDAGASEAESHHAPHYRYTRTTRTTRAGCEVGKGPVHVYGRQGRPCYECGDTITMVRQGAMHRSTYFCPTCQI